MVALRAVAARKVKLAVNPVLASKTLAPTVLASRVLAVMALASKAPAVMVLMRALTDLARRVPDLSIILHHSPAARATPTARSQ